MPLYSAMKQKNLWCMWATSATLAGLKDVRPTKQEEEDCGQGFTLGQRPPLAPWTTINADTPMANRTMYRLAEEMKKGRWIQLFQPKPAYLATWANMGNGLMQSFNSMSLEKLADSTVLLLRAIKYKWQMVPTKLMLANFEISLVSSELVRSKRKLKEVLWVQGGTKSLGSLNRQTQVYMVLVE